MVSRGLIIQECPSKQMAMKSEMTDNDVLPYPNEDDDFVEDN